MRLSEMGLGTFKISEALVEQNPLVVMALLGRCVVLRCEFIYPERAFHYMAYSPDFKPAIGDPSSPVRAIEYMWEIDSVTGLYRAIPQEDIGSGR
jgi:hypothetical protein